MTNPLFQQIVGNKPKRNVFDLSHERKFSMNMGELIPILCEEVIPGDTFRLNSEVLIRFAPMLAPIMHRINVYTHFFFVPNRLIWDEWEDFITGGREGDKNPLMPKIIVDQFSAKLDIGELSDYLGFATISSTPSGGVKVNAMPFRAYALIYNEYYRDQNLEEEINILKGSGDTANSLLLDKQTRAWEKDYFTSALPWTQRGGEVSLPISGNANVVYNQTGETHVMRNYATGNQALDGPVTTNNTANPEFNAALTTNGTEPINYDPNGTLEADMSSVTATTIEELRKATKLQQWLERNARGGARYIEQILSHFGVRSSDARLQRPEYLGGGKTPVTISEVLQQSGVQDVSGDIINTTPLGEMGGHGISVGSSHRFKKFFEEHGQVVGIMSVLPKSAYMQGTRKHLLKNDKFDYFFPEFAQLGEQPVDIRELYDDYTKTAEQTFGYQSRYAEYKYIPSTVHGDFKDTLSFWHMARDFAAEPVLNNDFIKAENIERIFAVTTSEQQANPKLWVQVYHNFKAIRPIPKFNNPSLL